MIQIISPQNQQPPPENRLEIGVSRRNRAHGFLGRLAGGQNSHAGLDPVLSMSILEALEPYSGQEVVAVSAGAVALQAILRSGPRIDGPLFIKDGLLGNRTLVTIAGNGDSPLWLPVSNFVSAPSFKDWSQGRGSKPKGPEERSSSSTIRRYARQPASTAPPIGHVSAFIQPDGLALFSVSDGAHRVGSAHARGDDLIAVGGNIPVFELAENIVPQELTLR